MPVNDAPSFTNGADQTVEANSGAKSVSGWATSIKDGPQNESAQTVTFSTSNDNNALFSAQPAVSPGGTLTFTPAANKIGSATVKVFAQDSGGTARGGVDTSAEQTFTITVRDTTAPSVSCSATPNKLRTSANNHKLVNIAASVNVTDGGSGPNGFKLISVTSNQADSGLGRDDVPEDFQGWTINTNDTTGQLRAERYGGPREYTLTYRGYDLAGNTTDCQAKVTVPREAK